MSTHGRSNRPPFELDALGIGLCVLITVAGYWLGVRPLRSVREVQGIQAAELRSRQADASAAADEVSRLRRELAEVEQAALRNPVELESAEQSNKRLNELGRMATAHGLKLQTVRTDVPRVEKYTQRIPIHLIGNGTFPDCTRFLHLLHERYPDMGVHLLDVSHNTPGTGAEPTFRFELAWYAAPSPTVEQK